MSDGTATEVQQQQDASQPVEVNDVELPEAEDRGSKGPSGQINILLETTVPVSVILGEAEVKARELLEMGPGSVLALDKEVGQPLDLYLRGIKFATGHLVVVGGNLGVRIHEILPATNVQAGESAEKV